MQVLEKSGVNIGRKRIDFIPATQNIRPLRNQIVVKPLPWEPSPTLKALGVEVIWQGGVLRGEVLAVGPGCYPKLYNKDRSKCWDSKTFRPCDVKAGDIVELGGLEIHGYQHWLTVQWGNDKVIIASEQDVTGIVDNGGAQSTG